MSEAVQERLDRLESLVEQQQATIEEQQETINRQRERIAELDGDPPASTTVAAPSQSTTR